MTDKTRFLQQEFVPLLHSIPANTPPHWGKMSVQQMIEHFADSVRIASGKTAMPDIVTPEEHREKMHSFLISEKPFRENTRNALLPEAPPPVRHATVEEAINELQAELNYFFAVFQNAPAQTTRNPFFGDLNFEENVQLLHKHAQHHLRQFGVAV